jgi:hypothetical protein
VQRGRRHRDLFLRRRFAVTVYDPDRPGERGPGAPGTARAARSDHSRWNWLLVIPLIATLYPPLYNRLEPLLFDIPLFYWYQLAAIGLSVVVTLVVYNKTRG